LHLMDLLAAVCGCSPSRYLRALHVIPEQLGWVSQAGQHGGQKSQCLTCGRGQRVFSAAACTLQGVLTQGAGSG
jgi:hypothetical protein